MNAKAPDAHKRIRKIAKYAEIFSVIGIAISAITLIQSLVLLAIDTGTIDRLIRTEYASWNFDITINATSRVATLFLELIPKLIGIYIFEQARLLFRQYRFERVFTYEAPRRLNRIGWAVVWLAPLGVLFQTLTVLALTAFNPPGDRHLAIGISETEVYAIILGLLLVTLAKILHEAATISDENQAFV